MSEYKKWRLTVVDFNGLLEKDAQTYRRKDKRCDYQGHKRYNSSLVVSLRTRRFANSGWEERRKRGKRNVQDVTKRFRVVWWRGGVAAYTLAVQHLVFRQRGTQQVIE